MDLIIIGGVVNRRLHTFVLQIIFYFLQMGILILVECLSMRLMNFVHYRDFPLARVKVPPVYVVFRFWKLCVLIGELGSNGRPSDLLPWSFVKSLNACKGRIVYRFWNAWKINFNLGLIGFCLLQVDSSLLIRLFQVLIFFGVHVSHCQVVYIKKLIDTWDFFYGEDSMTLIRKQKDRGMMLRNRR